MYLKLSTLVVILGVFCCGLLQVNQTALASVGKEEMGKVIGQGCLTCYNMCSGGQCNGVCNADDNYKTCGSANGSGQQIRWACINFNSTTDNCQVSGIASTCSAHRCYCYDSKCAEDTEHGTVSGNDNCSD